jgi:hypothetical protein
MVSADAGTTDASSVDAMVDAKPASANCVVVEPTYAPDPVTEPAAVVEPADPDFPDGYKRLSLSFDLDDAATPDRFYLELWEDALGPFSDGFVAASIALSLGGQYDLVECTACVFIAADVTQGEPLNFHMAKSGTLTIETVDATPDTGQLKGTITDLVLRDVNFGPEGQTPVEDACEITVPSLSFDVSVVAPAAP